MRISQPKNEYGHNLLSTADVVKSSKTVTKAISNGKVEITKSDLGADKASDWTVLEVIFEAEKVIADVAYTDDNITVTLDKEDSTFSGDVEVTLTYEAAMNITEDAQLPPVVVQGAMIDENGDYIGKAVLNRDVKTVGDKADFTEVTDGTYMFYNCTNLTSFDGDLSSLTIGSYMFYYCTNLTSFTGDMPALTNGTDMFYWCNNLTSFKGKLTALTNGVYMFSNCSNLTSFESDLSALTSGSNMFSKCKLDLASVNRIATSIPSYTSGSHPITIGVDSTKVSTEQQATANTIIVGKGWTVIWQRY